MDSLTPGEDDETIAVVIPTHNRRPVLQRAVESVFRQTYGGWELVIVDDGSTDDTVAYLTSIEDPRVHWCGTDRQGAASARNVGVGHSSASMITFLDSDDTARRDWLERLVHAFQHDGADIVSTAFEVVSPDGEVRTVPLQSMGPIFEGVYANFTHAGSWAVRREVFDAIGGFRPRMPASQHTELAFRLIPAAAESGWKLVGIEEPLICYYEGSADGIRRDDRAVLEAAEFMIETHGHLLRRDPGRLAASHAVAGVRAARLHERSRARAHFRESWLASRGSLRALLRWAMSIVWWARPRGWRS